MPSQSAANPTVKTGAAKDQTGDSQPEAMSDSPATSAKELALTSIRNAILTEKLPPGTPLRLAALAAGLSLSHMPVREALRTLSAEGLVVHRPNRGAMVAAVSIADVTSAYEALAALECLCIRQAASRLTAQNITELQGLLQNAEDAINRGDNDELLRLNQDFHTRLYAPYPNRWAHEFCRQLWNYVYPLRRRYPQSLERRRCAAREHLAILAAVEARDAELAGLLIMRHSEHAKDEMLAQLPVPAGPEKRSSRRKK